MHTYLTFTQSITKAASHIAILLIVLVVWLPRAYTNTNLLFVINFDHYFSAQKLNSLVLENLQTISTKISQILF